jgi:hypothetical protein
MQQCTVVHTALVRQTVHFGVSSTATSPCASIARGGRLLLRKRLSFRLPLAQAGISVQEKPCLCILHHPLQPLLQIHPSHRTAGYDGPFMCFDRVQLEPLKRGVNIGLTTPADIPNPHFGLLMMLTSRMSSSVMAPVTSVLFLKTRRLAPIRRYTGQLLVTFEVQKKYFFEKEAGEFLSTVVDALAVCGVDNPDECICFLKVILPIRSQCFLASYVPCYRSACAGAPYRCSFAHMFSLYLPLSAFLPCGQEGRRTHRIR